MPVCSCHCSQTARGSVSPAETHVRRLERSNSLRSRGHRAVRDRRGKERRHAVRRDRVEQFGRAGLFEQERRGAGADGKEQYAAEPERERQRRASAKEIARPRLQHARPVAVAAGRQVAVIVHRRLRRTRRPRSEGDDRDVFGRGFDVGKVGGLRAHPLLERLDRMHAVAEVERSHAAVGAAGALQVGAQPHVAERVLDLRFLHHETQFVRAVERHRRDGDSAGLEHAYQQAASIGVFGARSSTRFPGSRPISSTSTPAMRFAVASSSA